MTKKEQIILATLELASQNGLGAVSMGQIADRLGIRKPSLYNHFESKEAIIAAMYEYLRERSKEGLSLGSTDYGELVKGRTAKEALLGAVESYRQLNAQPELLSFYRLIYSQRAIDPAAAAIMREETRKMIGATKSLFYALQVHGKLRVRDIDAAALSFAMTVHSMLDYSLDCAACGERMPEDMLEGYVEWFCNEFGGAENERQGS